MSRQGLDGILQNPFEVCFECRHFKEFMEKIQDLVDYCVSNELTLNEAYDFLLAEVDIETVLKPFRVNCAYYCNKSGFNYYVTIYKGDAVFFLLLSALLLNKKEEKEKEKRSKMTYGRKPKAYERYGKTIQNLYQYADEEEETKKLVETTEKKKKRLHTIQEISDITGLSTATVQKIIHQLKAEGKIK